MAIKTRYRIKNASGNYDVIHFQTSADQVITSDDLQFVTLKEKEQIGKSTTYTHNQLAAAKTWDINHNLGKFPSVSIVDSAGTVVIGDVTYVDSNNIQLSFTSDFSGVAYLN